MKDLLIQALTDAFELVEKQVPQTKKETKEISFGNVKPIDVVVFMEENGIPDDAYLTGGDDEGQYGVFLCWDVEVPTTEADKLKFVKKQYSNVAWQYVYKLLTANGYKRIPYDSSYFRKFNDTTLYNMFIEKDFDRLVEYYSGFFIKV